MLKLGKMHKETQRDVKPGVIVGYCGRDCLYAANA